MPAPETLPRYVYKIVDSEPPSPIPEVFPPSELDKADGFIHLSTASQIPITTSLFFTAHTTLWLIKIRYELIASLSKWEAPPNNKDSYPHLYGSFGAAEAESVERFERTGAAQEWKDVFAASSWLK